MRKIFFTIAIIIVFLGLQSCQGLSTRQGAVPELRIVSAPSTVSDSATSSRDTSVTVSVENCTDSSLFNSELATAYLSSYRASLKIDGKVFDSVELPERKVIKQGATVDIETILITREEKQNILKKYGTFNQISGYVEVEYKFADNYGNTLTLTYKPLIHLTY